MVPFQPNLILYTPDALNALGQSVLAGHPLAETEEIKQHNRLPDLGMGHYKWKSSVLVLGRLKTLENKVNGRSADFIAPSLANGCTGACAYCYVDRHKRVNPITLFTNVDEILATVDRHVHTLPWPRMPYQTDPTFYTYDIGCNSDISVDAAIAPESMRRVFEFYREHPRAKATFATKFVNPDLLNFDPARKVRIRYSLLPAAVSKLVDVRTDAVEKRLWAVNDFYDAGYEVHLNFSPVIVYDGDRWLDDYRELFRQVNGVLRADVKAQCQCEVIFLTHNRFQHLANLEINPRAEEVIWAPDIQEGKRSQQGGFNIRYQHDLKAGWMAQFEALLAEELPWCRVRYIF